MITVRSILKEALSRANLVSRRQSAPADMEESAFRLFKGIAAKYSNDNLLQFLVSDVEHPLDKEEFVMGETDGTDNYREVDIFAKDVQRINKVYWRASAGNADDRYNFIELLYASPTDFDSYPVGSAVYTAQPINDLQTVIKTKMVVTDNLTLKINYNKKWNVSLDTELRVPEQYEELFIASLTHALAVAFPRLNNEQVALLKNQLDEIEKNVKTSTRAIKYISRSPTKMACTYADFLSGNIFVR